MNPTTRILSLNLTNLTQEQIDWLHELKNKAQRIQSAMYLKSEGIKSLKKETN
mgnify:CR=1 FL=1